MPVRGEETRILPVGELAPNAVEDGPFDAAHDHVLVGGVRASGLQVDHRRRVAAVESGVVGGRQDGDTQREGGMLES